MSIVIRHPGKVGAQRGVPRKRPGCVARQHVDFTRLKRREAIFRRQRNELDLGGVVKDRSGDRTADVDVEASPVALVVRRRKARQPLADATGQHAPILDRLERLRGSGLGRETSRKCKGKNQRYAFHDNAFQLSSRNDCRSIVHTDGPALQSIAANASPKGWTRVHISDGSNIAAGPSTCSD